MTQKKKYLNNAQQRAVLVNPWSYYGIMGRGSGKSVGILAARSADLSYQMPGASFGWYGDSYINLQSNLVPNVIKGWRDINYHEGIHFVRDQRPPDHFDRPMFEPKTWKHTIVWCTGTIFFLISDDRPDSARGRSLQHIFGDEIKLINFDKMKAAVFPAIRGERIHFGHIPQFQGFTFTTDMPDRDNTDWLFEKETQMDRRQIEMIGALSLYWNALIMKMIKSQDKKYKQKIQKAIDLVGKKLQHYRYKSLYFDQASTFINIDALGLDAIDNMLLSLGWTEFKASVLNIKPDAVDNMFYAGFGNEHLYQATNYDYYDSFGISENIDRNSVGDKDVTHTAPLDGGMDFGNMNSLAIGQEVGQEFRVLNFLYALDPQKMKDLAKKFTNYYKFHKKKLFNLYYDRAANARRPDSNVSYAEEFKQEILKQDNSWTVNLKSQGWRNVPHQDRRLLWLAILDNKNNNYPNFRMNENNCRELKSSIQLAPTKVVEGVVKKDKSSERKKLEELPMQSTNASDAIDYLIWGKYGDILPGKSKSQPYDVSFNE